MDDETEDDVGSWSEHFDDPWVWSAIALFVGFVIGCLVRI